MKMKIVYRTAVSSSAALIGMGGFWVGYSIILKIYEKLQTTVVIFLFFAIGCALFIATKRLKVFYGHFLNGETSYWLRGYLWWLTVGFELSFIVLPLGGITAFVLAIIRSIAT